MSPRGDTGAIPLQRLVELDSDVHHLRGQADMDRRQFSERNLSLEDRIKRIDERVEEHGKLLASIGGSITTVKWMVAAILPAAIATAWELGRLIK